MTARIGSMPVLVVSLVWAGLLAGVSFLATPVKFAAPSLDLPVALDVGRHTFALLNRVELAFGALLLVLVIATLRRRGAIVALALLLVLIGAQTIWLLPALDARVELIMQGETPPPSLLHTVYIGAEILKLACLAILAVLAARRGTPIPDTNP